MLTTYRHHVYALATKRKKKNKKREREFQRETPRIVHRQAGAQHAWVSSASFAVVLQRRPRHIVVSPIAPDTPWDPNVWACTHVTGESRASGKSKVNSRLFHPEWLAGNRRQLDQHTHSTALHCQTDVLHRCTNSHEASGAVGRSPHTFFSLSNVLCCCFSLFLALHSVHRFIAHIWKILRERQGKGKGAAEGAIAKMSICDATLVGMLLHRHYMHYILYMIFFSDYNVTEPKMPQSMWKWSHILSIHLSHTLVYDECDDDEKDDQMSLRGKCTCSHHSFLAQAAIAHAEHNIKRHKKKTHTTEWQTKHALLGPHWLLQIKTQGNNVSKG